MARHHGTIRRLVRNEGFGFITDDAAVEFIFHCSTCQLPFDELEEGQEVSFELIETSHGQRMGAIRRG